MGSLGTDLTIMCLSVFGHHVALEIYYRGAPGACFRRRNLRNPGFTARIPLWGSHGAVNMIYA